jgi:DNA-directed RNA polymerase subunit F
MNEIIETYRKKKTWSEVIYREFGPEAGVSFAAGMQILNRKLNALIKGFDKNPGAVCLSLENPLYNVMPEQWQYLEKYNATFLTEMKQTAQEYLDRVRKTEDYYAHSVMEEIILRACMLLAEEPVGMILDQLPEMEMTDEDEVGDDGPWYVDEDGEPFERNSGYDEWVYILFNDDDIDDILPCGSQKPLMDAEKTEYAFKNWNKKQFW